MLELLGLGPLDEIERALSDADATAAKDDGAADRSSNLSRGERRARYRTRRGHREDAEGHRDRQGGAQGERCLKEERELPPEGRPHREPGGDTTTITMDMESVPSMISPLTWFRVGQALCVRQGSARSRQLDR